MRFLLPLLALPLLGCGSKCPEPQYEGRASDEAYLTMLDAETRATADDMKAPVLALADGAQLPSSPVPTFRWSSTLASLSPSPLPRAAPKASPWWRGLLVSEAHAHLPPVTGVIYWFKIAVPGEQCPVELLSTRSEWTPSDAIWTRLRAGTGARSLTAQAAYLNENRITEGPFKTPAAVTFTVSP